MKNAPAPLISTDRDPVFHARVVSDARSIPAARGEGVLKGLDALFIRVTTFTGSAVPSHLNPFSQMGAVANSSFAIAIVTGILLLFWYSPSVVHAYESVEAMGESPYLAGLLRSLHRYSSDMCMLFIALHGFQALASRKFGGSRWLAWISGMVLLGLFFIDGWTGYWLVWDERARQIALGTAQFLDVLPVFPDPLLRSFLTNEGLNSLFFFIIFFIHMLIPLGMGIFLWVHIMRINQSHFFTGKAMTTVIVVVLVFISLLLPVSSVGMADMTAIPQDISIDWFYLLPLYLTDRLSGPMLWLVLAVATVVLFAVPWYLTRRKPVQVVVDEMACNGCTQCFKDCPYNAIQLLPRTDGKGGAVFARVDTTRCVGCGICVGSCDSSGIDQAILPLLDVRRYINQHSADQHVAFICAESAGASLEISPVGTCKELPGYQIIPVPCAGWVHMLTVERALRRGAKGVLVAGCNHDPICRMGTDWTAERLAGIREPELRHDKVDADRVLFIQFDRFEKKAFLESARGFQAGDSVPKKRVRTRPVQRTAVVASVVAGLSLATFALSDAAYLSPFRDKGELAVSFKLAGDYLANDDSVAVQADDVPFHMRRDQPAQRERVPVRLRIEIDGIERINAAYQPGGLFNDGASVAIEELSVPIGEHDVRIMIGTSEDATVWDHRFEDRMTFERARRRVVLFDRGADFIVR